MKKIILFLLAILLCLQSYCQVVRVGNGTDTCDYLPFSPSNWTHYSQQIILASEINADSTSKYITDIGFDPFTQGVFTYELRGMTILIGNTTANSLSQGYLPHSQMSICKSSNFTSLDDNMPLLHLDVPFEWDRTSNIVIAFLKNTSYTSSGNSWGFLTHTTVDSLTKYDITSGYSLEYPPTQGILTNKRLNTQLRIIGCFKPDSIHYTNISSNSIDFIVFKRGDATNWEVQYKEKTDTSWANASSIISSDTNISLINLIENTYYDVRVRSVCSQWNRSEWIESEFKTKCLPILTFPYLEQFTGNVCWENLYNTTFGTFYNGATFNATFFDAYSSNAYLISPALIAHLDSLMISFEATNSDGIFTIGVMSSSDTNTFQSLLSIPNPHGLYEVNLSTSTLQGVNNYIGLKQEGGFAFIKDVKIDFIPPCPSINKLNVHTISPTQISVDWSKFNSINNGYQIAYNAGDSFDTNNANIINLNDTIILPYVIDNLLPSTNYSIAVRQNCGSGWSVKNERTFSLPAQIPYSCDFEDSIASYSWTFSNNGNGYFEISQDFDSINKHLLEIRKSDSTNNSSSTIVASRLLKSSGAGGYKLSFKTKSMNASWYVSSYVKVYVLDPDTMYYGLDNMNYYSDAYYSGSLKINNQYSVQLNNNSDYIIDLPYLGVVGTVKKLMFVVYSAYTDGELMGLDDIKIEERECVAPELSIVNSSVNNVELSWTSGYSDSTWVLFYKPIDSIAYSFVSLDTTSYILDSLNQTQYNAYVRVLCGNGNWIESNVITFSPQCEKITLPFSENFDNRPISSFPFCWTKSNNVSLNNQTSYAPTTTLLLNNNTYVSLPELEDSISISSAVISFKYRKNGYYSRLIIGVMENPNDLSTFDTITILNTPSDYLWHRGIANLNNYTGLGKYIAILSQYSNRIDDITVDYYHQCPVVYDLSADSISYSMVRLRWDTTNNQHQGYQISYLLDGDSLNNETIININEATINFPYQINGLNSNSNYRIGIRQNCGGNWSYTNITTKHAPATLPYYCDFSNETERYSWEISNGNAPNKWFIGQAVNQSPIEGYSLYVSEDNGLNNTYSVGYFSTGDKNSTVVASRLIELTGAGSYSLNFNSRVGGENNNDYIKVFLVDEDVVFTGSATSTSYANQTYTNGVILFTGNNPYYCNPANPTTINNHTIQLPYLGINGTIKKLIFVWTNNARNGTQPPAAIDNISIIPNSCVVSELHVLNISDSSALASWSAYMNDSSWYLYIKENDSINYDSIPVTNNLSYSFSNLLPNTKYNAYLRLVCDSTLSETSNVVTFTTDCNPSTQIPFYEDFETYNSSNYIDCWNRINPLNNNTPRVYNGGYQSSYSLGLYYPNSYPNTSSYALLPTFDTSIHINDLFMRFMMQGEQENLIVGIMSDENDVSTFDSITTLSTTETSWVEKIVYFNNYTGNGNIIAFKAKVPNTYSSYPYIDIDNIYIDNYINCFTPSNLTVSNITTDSAELNWTTITIPAPNCWLYYKQSTDASFDSIYVTSLPYHLNNLDHSTFYDFYVRLDCNNNPTNNSDTITFQTQCGKISSFPNLENFDSYSNFGLNYPLCWSSINNPTIVQDYCTSSPSSLMLNSNITTPHYVITPQIGENINRLKVKFKMKKMISLYGYQTSKLIVGVMSDKNDTSTFEEVYDVLSIDTIMREYEVLFNSTLLTGIDKYIAFKTSGGYYNFRLDDIEIDYIPQCAQPTQLSINNVGADHATINWLPSNSSDTAWYLYYKKIQSATTDSVYVNSIPYNLNGLNQVSTYDVYVKTICSSGLSVASHSSQFTTPCATISEIPFFENFDTVDWMETDMLPCWSGFSSRIIFTYNSPPNGLGISANTNQYAIASTPQIDPNINISDLKVSLSIKRPFYYVIYLTVGVMSDPNDRSTFDSITSIAATYQNIWETVTVDFSNYTGNGRFIAFQCYSCNYYIDDVLIEYNNSYSPPCAQPNLLSISNISDSSAYFTWSPVGDETSWEVSLDTLSLDTLVNHIIVNDTNYQFSHLTDSTLYTAYVRSNCVYSNSQWIGVNFTTNHKGYCLPPTNALITNITDRSAYFSWQKSDDETIWEVTLDTTITPIQVTDTNYSFNNLLGSTNYIAFVRAVDYSYVSNWVGVNFTTLETILEGEVRTLDATSITDSSAILNGLLISNGNDTTGIDMGFLLSNQSDVNLLTENVIKVPIIYNNNLTDFHYRIVNLPSDSLFYYTAYFVNNVRTVYGEVKSFTTLSLNNDILSDELSLNVFPNPTNNSSVLRINNLKDKAIVSVYDLFGRQITNYDIDANRNELILNTKNYPSGIYYIKLTTNNINKTIKLIVNH